LLYNYLSTLPTIFELFGSSPKRVVDFCSDWALYPWRFAFATENICCWRFAFA